MNKVLKKAAVVVGILVIGALACVVAHATSVATTRYQGKTYTVDVMPAGNAATIYFRAKANTCSAGDIYIGTLTPSTKVVKKNETLRQAAASLCTVKSLYDTGKMVVGCGASLGSAACLVASVPTGGTTALVCSAMIVYTLNSGLKDCVLGISDRIASYLAGERPWKALATTYGIATGSWSSAIDNAIDLACTYAR